MRRRLRENLVPLAVLLVFLFASLFSARQLVNHTSRLHERYLSNHAVAQDLGRAFNDFEALFLAYLSEDTPRTEMALREGIDYAKVIYANLSRTINANDVADQFMVHADGLKTDILVLENIFKPANSMKKADRNLAATAALNQIHVTLSDLTNDLALDHHRLFNGDETNRHRYFLYGSVLLMALAGIGLVVVLVFKIDRMEDADEDKEKTLKMLGDRMVAIELAGEGIVIAESDGRLSFANRAFAEIYGYPGYQALIGKKWVDLCHDDLRKMLTYEVIPVLVTGGFWSGTGSGVRKDGTIFKKSISVSALPGQRWILVIRDVSDEIRMEELSSQRLAAIEAAGDGIGIVDAEGRLVYMNRALKALHEFDEYEAQDRIGKSWDELYTDLGKEQIREIVMPALKQHGYWKGESPILTKSGKVVYAEMTLTLLPDGGLTGTARDITDRIQAEKERIELEKQFFQAQKMEAVGRLAGGIAHDFNNILAAMMGYAEFLIEDLPPDSQDYKFAKSIHDGGTQARDVIERLLMFSRTHDHKMEPLDLGVKVLRVLDLLRSSIPTTVLIDFKEPEEEMPINGNKTLILQALMNICLNARDAIGDNHGQISIAIRYESSPSLSPDYHVLGELDHQRSYYVVSIADDGCGMDEKVMERIFDPFFTTKEMDKGTGLGLSSVHGVMASHDGAVAVRSAVGVGTEFLLFFPECTEAMLAMPFENAIFHPEASLGEKFRVMIVDDQDDVRRMMAEMLGRLGYETHLHPDAAAALDHLTLDPTHFALVITDQTMPGMTGSELAAKIAETFPDLPVLLMSGFARDNMAEIVSGIPSIVGILHKPVDREDLSRAVARALSGLRKAA